ncbi:CASP-like protein 4D1 [Pyrus communis]|uniref:CASP-like protein 4D1 n=1 Tax=Pyrus communis TaxID=23211 RepID=UPI0035C0F530
MPSSKAIPNSILVLRIFTLLSLVGSGVLLVLDNFTLEDGTETHFYDILSFRFILSTAAIGAAYTLFQLPFGIYYALTEKRLIRNECMPQFDFYGDNLVSLLLASGVGAGFGVGFDFKKFLKFIFPVLAALGGFPESELDEAQSKNSSFFDKEIIATGILLFGAVCMSVVSVLSSITRTSNRGYFG